MTPSCKFTFTVAVTLYCDVRFTVEFHIRQCVGMTSRTAPILKVDVM